MEYMKTKCWLGVTRCLRLKPKRQEVATKPHVEFQDLNRALGVWTVLIIIIVVVVVVAAVVVAQRDHQHRFLEEYLTTL